MHILAAIHADCLDGIDRSQGAVDPDRDAACAQQASIPVLVRPLSTKLPEASTVNRALTGAVVFFWYVASILEEL